MAKMLIRKGKFTLTQFPWWRAMMRRKLPLTRCAGDRQPPAVRAEEGADQGVRRCESPALLNPHAAPTTVCPSRRGDRVAEGARLLSEYATKSCIEGSNPSLSATSFWRDDRVAEGARLESVCP